MHSKVSPWRSLKTRTAVSMLAVFALGIWSLSFFISRNLQTDMVRLLGAQQFSVVTTVANEVNRNLIERLQALESIAKLDGTLISNPAALQASLERRPALLQLFNGGVWVAGPDGTAIADVPLSAHRLGVNYMDRDFIAAPLKEGKPTIGRPIMGKQLKAPIFAMTVPIRDAQGKVMGAMVGVTNLGQPNFLDALTQSTYGKKGSYFLAAPQHQLVVTGSDATRIMQQLPPPGANKMLDRFLQGYEGHGLSISSRGVEQIIAAKGIPVAGWFLALSVPTAEALGPLRDQQQRLIWATLALTLLTGALTWLVLQRQFAPVVETAQAMAALADSTHIPQPLSSTHPGEIGLLVAGFNRILQTWTQRQAELQASEQQYRSLVENLSAGVVVHRPDTSISLSNPRAAALLGLTQDQMLGKTAPDPDWCFIREDETPMPLEDYPVNFVLSSGRPLENYVLGVCHPGRTEPTWLIGNAFPMRDGQGKIFQVVVTFTDITKRVRAEMDLQHSRVMLERTENLVRLASFEWDVDTNIVNWSPEMFRIFGRDPTLGTPNLQQQAELYTPASTQALFDAVGKALSDGAPYTLELMAVRSDGELRPCLAKGFPERDASGRVVRVAGLVQDITERKQVEAALLASEERWKFAIEGAGDGLWDWNIQTGKAFYSTRYKTMLGFSEEDIGDSADEWSKRIHPDDAPGVFAAMQPYMEGKPGSAIVEFRMLCKDGSWQWTMGRGMVVARDADGKPLRMIGTNSDITERKQAEQYEHFRNRTMELLVTNEALGDALETIVLGVEQLHPDMLCSILLLDSDGRHLGKGVAPSLPDFYNEALDGIEIGVGVGSCGTAAFTGERVIVTDIATHPYWTPYKDLAARADLGACWSQPIRGALGQVLGTFAIYHRHAHTPVQSDIDLIEQTANLTSVAIERKRAQEKLQLAAGVFTHALEGIMITAADATIIDVNDAFTRITGYSREDAIGQNPRLLSSGRHDRHFYEAMWGALVESGHWSGEVWNRRKDGEVFAEMLTISAVKDMQGNTHQYVALFSDITASKEHQSQLEHIAHFDALTNLPNRVLLADRLQQAMSQASRRQQQLAVAYLDLDGFKTINDRHGHEAGDQVLITLAHRMKEALRDGDTMARLGGDEFVAVLIDLEDTSASLPLLQRLLAAAALPVQLGDLNLQVSASLGVTFYPQAQDIDADQLLRQADQAMYQAKVAGKNRYCVFDAAQDSSIRDHHESLERIRLALARGEFVLYYQPKVNMQSGKVTGAEALIRWQHPEKGLLAPATFLPAIEDHPLGVEVGEWVIHTALRQMELWHAVGLDLPVSVNISARQLQQGDFVARLQAILAKHPQVNPASLELEVLETSALNDMDQVSQVIDDCHEMGVKFALDDFGTGYSSLTYLKRLRVALLKIDQSFVRDMLDDPDDLAILQGVIGLAAAFKREVIAEGVETVAHGTALLRLGCELAQGYGIARPMPAEQLPAWAATWQPDAAWCELPWLGGGDPG
jgi:diguanylate cyclase (GGDEF)-like protein/PAS domain S-box-containing protein